MVSLWHYASPMGPMTLAADEQGLTGLWFDGQKYDRLGLPEAYETRLTEPIARAAAWLDRYFAGEDPGALPPLHLVGSPFRLAVWEILLTIPRGKTMTYGEIAERLAAKRGDGRLSAQAVGGAVGHNPVSVIVSCHRVVGADGRLTGYAGGVDKKKALLLLEGAVPAKD